MRLSSRSRLATVVTSGVAVAVVSGCGTSGVFTDGSVAARNGTTTVTTDQVQTALQQIAPLDGEGSFKAPQAATLLALQPEVNRVARATGVGVSDDEVRELFRRVKVDNPTPSAIGAVRTSSQISTLTRGTSQQMSAIQRVLDTAKVELNPRYGRYGKGGEIAQASTNWLKTTDPAAPTS